MSDAGQRARPAHGLVLGKFLPPHAGHLHLVRQAAAGCERLTVVVASLTDEPIPGAQRVAWMRELLAPYGSRVRVVPLVEALPSFPHEAPDFWERWTRALRAVVPDPVDVVFTSEDYGDELARRLGARHVLVDRDRQAVPVTGSAIRRDPLAHWAHLPAPVRPWFVRRVVVTGSESTGKTTLAARLAAHYGTAWSAEYARTYLDEKVARTGEALDAGDVEPIARGQVALEDARAREANGLLVLDTDLVSTVVYATEYYGACPPWIMDAARARRAELYLLCDVDVPWIADPQRDRGDAREHMHALFARTLDELGARFVIVRGDWEQRFAIATAAVDELVSGER